MPTAREVALVSRRLTARFDGRRLRVTAGRTSWTVPVGAIASAEPTSDGTVRVVFSGRAAHSTHGLGDGVDLPAGTADVFARVLRDVVATSTPAADGHALITRTEDPSWLTGRYGRLVTTWGLFVLGGLSVLLLQPLAGSVRRDDAVGLVAVIALTGAAGGFLLWRVVRRVRSLLILRRRGVEALGVSVRDHAVGGWGALFTFPVMDFRTVDGHLWRGVVSVASAWSFRARRREVALVYDPLDPRRASRPFGPFFLLRTLVLAVPAVALLYAAGLCVYTNLPL
ncbi:hypothetical protein AB0I28_15115 [Phytomonospora sp. NPDC050363]|uniref:hypothetical protein n=1 Tax=Phytomonospora sp. NPDC050363 TaxID=3155642 RepID=UPI0033FE3531